MSGYDIIRVYSSKIYFYYKQDWIILQYIKQHTKVTWETFVVRLYVQRGNSWQELHITEEIIIFIHRLMESHQLKVMYRSGKLINITLFPSAVDITGQYLHRSCWMQWRIQRSHVQFPTNRKRPHLNMNSYALECTIWSLGLFFLMDHAATHLEQITGWLCQLVCKKYCKTSAPNVCQFLDPPLEWWIKSAMCFHLYLVLWLYDG